MESGNINGVQYIPMSEVRTHYKLTRERTEGRQKVYEVPEKIQIRIQAQQPGDVHEQHEVRAILSCG